MKKGKNIATIRRDILRLLKEKFPKNRASLEMRYNIEDGKIKQFFSVWVYHKNPEKEGVRWSTHRATLFECRKVLEEMA